MQGIASLERRLTPGAADKGIIDSCGLRPHSIGALAAQPDV